MRIYCFVLCILTYVQCSAQDELVLSSDRLPGNDTVWIFKPAGYTTNQKFPVVYLLHGLGGKYDSWNKLVNLQDYADIYGFMIICPDGFTDSYFFDSPLIKNSKFETFFTKELYPFILKKYAVDSSKIFITGLSMGGAGAMYLFIRNQQLFLGAGSTSGVFNLNDSGSKYKSLSRLLGDYLSNQKRFNEYSVINLLANLKGSDKQIIFDCGRNDPFYKSNNELNVKCDELGINATYISQPGTHNHTYWKKAIKQHFDFFRSLVDDSEK